MLVLSQPTSDTAPRRNAQQPRWVWSQTWSDVFLLHWPIKAELLQTALPSGLTLERFAGDAWLSLVIFRLSLRPVGLPYVPLISFFTEVNLRTYVRCGERTGIYFLSIDAHNRLAVALARRFTPLPYRYAELTFKRDPDCFHFQRTDKVPTSRMRLCGTGLARPALVGSRDKWLLERYTAFASRDSKLFWGEATHPPWHFEDVQSAWAGDHGVWWPGLPDGPPAVQHYAPRVEALFSEFHPV